MPERMKWLTTYTVQLGIGSVVAVLTTGIDVLVHLHDAHQYARYVADRRRK